MRHKTRRLEYLCKRLVANTQAPGVGAERRHDGALTVADKTAPLDPSRTRWHARLGMKVSGDFAGCTGRLVAKRDRANGDFARDDAAEIGRQGRIVIA